MATAEELQKMLDDEKQKNADNIKALQQKLTENDVALKKTLKELEDAKNGNQDNDKVKDLEQQIKTLSDSFGTLAKETELAKISAKYPDIVPDLLLGKSEEEREAIVAKQKAITEKNYVSRVSSHAPIYSNESEIDAEMEKVKGDKSLSTADKFVKIGELKKAKAEL